MSGDREWHTDVMVGKYTQTKKMQLRAKIVKSNQRRHYKKKPFMCTVTRTTGEEEDRIENFKKPGNRNKE